MRFHPFLNEGEGGGGGAAPVPTIKVQHAGAELEVPRPAGYFSQAEVNEKFVAKATHDATMASMRTQLEKSKNLKNPDDLLGDDSFKTRAMEAWGLNPNATQKQFNEQLERTRKEILDREVQPREVKLTQAQEKISKLRSKDLHGQIIQAAAAAGIQKDLLKPTTKGGTPMIVSMLRDAFDFSEEHDSHFAKGANGYAYSQTGETPYMTPHEFIAAWAAGDGKAFVTSERQAGAEAGAGGKGTSVPGQVGKELRLTADQIRDISYFKQMQDKAAKEGLTIVPV
jgi:hypothetical protein